MISPLLRRYTWNSAWLYNVRIFIALCGTTLFPWWIGEVKLTIPLTLGVVAAALTDLDDRLAGRLRNLAITLVCFFIASASVELLFPWPPLFALGLTVSTIGFILLGGLGQRYATIAFGALLIAIYTMLGVTLYDHWYLQPLFLLAGAVWYNLLTLSGHLIFPIRPLQDNLARSYEQLARYLELKSRLFDPDLEDESQAPLYDLALANGQLVATLNQTKVSLLTRLRGDRGQRGTRRTLVRVLEVALRLAHPFMPFITEEIWQRIAPLAGVEGKTIMLQPWPVPNEARIDQAAEDDIEWLKGLMLGTRNIRGEMNIGPGKPLQLYLKNVSSEDQRRLTENDALLKKLAKLESITVLQDGAEAPLSATALVGEMEVLVPMAGLIDKDAELARLDKEIQRLNGEVARVGGKLSNAAFVDKAPAEVIEKERAKLAEAEQALSKLADQHARISSL